MASLAESSDPLVESRARRAQKVDWWLVLASAILLLIGFMSLYSIDAGPDGSRHFFRQFIRLAIGIAPFLLFLLVNPRALLRYAAPIYAINLALLLLVLTVGVKGGGAQRWISLGPIEFQPSEMAKLFLTITLASFYAARADSVGHLSTLALSLLHVAVPLALIFKQPHLGGALAVLAIWFGISISAMVPAKYLAAVAVAIPLLLGLAWATPGVLSPYQKGRVLAMFDPDPLGNRLQAIRAEMAFGSGGLTGVGFLKGEQKQGFVPEQHTDFILTVIGEEGGLFGCTLVLAAYGFFLYRVWLVMLRASEPFYQMVAAGIFSVLAFHTVANIGMNLGMLPVVGLWLPFMSYGGTAIWLCLASVALLLNIRSRDRPVLF